MKNLKNARFLVIFILILAGSFSRMIPHPSNFTAIAAIGLFGGFYLKNLKQTFLIVFGSMLLSDIIIGFHTLMPIVYAALLVPIMLGHIAQHSKTSIPLIMTGSLSSSLSFFIITNFAVWGFSSLYPKTLEGFLMCYAAAIPFFQNQLIGDIFYTFVIFGIFFICQITFPTLQARKIAYIR